MQDEPACAVVKVAYRARSIRDNLELFEILRNQTKPTIALGMGDFGLMSRILAPKFGGFLTFASLRDESTTAPGQITIEDLLNLYRFRSIKPTTKVYGIIGWPVKQSMSPLVHNAGFEQIGWDGVYVPMPVEGSYESFKATVSSLCTFPELSFSGASVTIPHKQHLVQLLESLGEQRLNLDTADPDNLRRTIGAANTITNISCDDLADEYSFGIHNTDAMAVLSCVQESISNRALSSLRIMIQGSGGVARAAAFPLAQSGADTIIFNRNYMGAHNLYSALLDSLFDNADRGKIFVGDSDDDFDETSDVYINCTPVGMSDGPDESGVAIPVARIPANNPNPVFFDTVYNPIETPMLKAAKERGYRTIDGVQMFVKQAAAQFSIWTGQAAPEDLFDKLVREKLSV